MSYILMSYTYSSQHFALKLKTEFAYIYPPCLGYTHGIKKVNVQLFNVTFQTKYGKASGCHLDDLLSRP